MRVCDAASSGMDLLYLSIQQLLCCPIKMLAFLCPCALHYSRA
jgi:hypothetical protein